MFLLYHEVIGSETNYVVPNYKRVFCFTGITSNDNNKKMFLTTKKIVDILKDDISIVVLELDDQEIKDKRVKKTLLQK